MPDLETQLESALRGRGNGSTVAADDLDRLWWEWFDDSYRGRRGRDTFLRVLRQADTGADPDGELGFRLGGWEIDLGKTAVQASLVSAFISGLLGCRRAGVSDQDANTIALAPSAEAKFRITFR